MKKLLHIVTALFIIGSSLAMTAHAAAPLPSAAVWFTPADAKAGETVTLNALVYNNEKVDATVTLSFSAPDAKIPAVTAAIPAQTAKTISTDWKMPAQNTVVTATVTAAADKNKHSLPSLLGVVGTVTVGNAPAPLISGVSFPGSSQLNAWFAPFLGKIEAFRKKEAATFTALRDKTKKAVTSNPSEVLHHPALYGTLLYASAAATMFSSPLLFYVFSLLVILLALRFVVNLVF